MKSKLELLRREIEKANVDAFLVPSKDMFLGEYVPSYYRRLEWLTGFTGSNGLAIILRDKAAFFTDGRYILQAQQQVDTALFEIYNISNIKPWEWLDSNDKVAYDPMIFSKDSISLYKSQMISAENFIDKIWLDRPKKESSDVKLHYIEAIDSHLHKVDKVKKSLQEEGTNYLIISSPDSICWLLNIRAHDVPFTPFLLSYAVIDEYGNIDLFIHDKNDFPKLDYFANKLQVNNLDDLPGFIKKIDNEQNRILVDPIRCPVWFSQTIKKAQLIERNDPCQLMKAIKSKEEINGAKLAHKLDAIAVCKFIKWLKENVNKQPISELGIAEKLLECRKQTDLFVEPSFTTIAGFRENGAIIHYSATLESSKNIEGNGLLLTDSGGQYRAGTTDITRTFAIGRPTQEQIDNYTRVLKGHLALAKAKFPQGTTGSQLDVLARYPLWQSNLDYAHGTGHGVGSYLSVHEGPHNISKVYNDVPLAVGMLLSNEPGYYKENEYGIRIENVVLVQEGNYDFLKFVNLTLVPYERELINESMLSCEEKSWINDYYSYIICELKDSIDNELLSWLIEYAKPFEI